MVLPGLLWKMFEKPFRSQDNYGNTFFKMKVAKLSERHILEKRVLDL